MEPLSWIDSDHWLRTDHDQSRHRYLAHFDKYHTQLDDFANKSDNAKWEQVEKFNRYSKPPRCLKKADSRIKVAIIDNGADINRSNLRKRIHAGVSYVSADKDQPQQPLPWWMVSDPHGTQMASLVEKVNPHCRLYIARVKARSLALYTLRTTRITSSE